MLQGLCLLITPVLFLIFIIHLLLMEKLQKGHPTDNYFRWDFNGKFKATDYYLSPYDFL
jgi:hypothetical protein